MKKIATGTSLAMCALLALTPAFSAQAAGETEMADEGPGITVPAGFKATVFADDIGPVRHIVVRSDGSVYGALYQQHGGGGVVALKDDDGDGVADRTEYFGDLSGSGIGLNGDYLYFGTNVKIVRFKLEAGKLAPTAGPEDFITGFREQGQHAAKPFTFDGAGHIYVNVGAPSNACQQETRTPESPGQKPCPHLEHQAGIWRFADDRPGQTQDKDGHRYATGIRNGMAIAWNPLAGALYFATHGRDQLGQLWDMYYTEEESAELPAEEFHRVEDGSNHGWPYTYWDPQKGQRMVNPEYGGDGKTPDASGKYKAPLVAFPGHWGPNGLVFYSGNAFPEGYRGGAFIAFHGSWNRAPLPQDGYKVVFVPMKDGKPSGDWQVFADGFKQQDTLYSPGDARFRPTGLAVGPDGALYIGADQGSRIWRVTYEGE